MKVLMQRNLVVLLFVIFSNHWIWVIFQKNLLITIVLVFFSIAVYVINQNSANNRLVLGAATCLFVALIFLFASTTLKAPLLKPTALQLSLQQQRVNYYAIDPVPALPASISSKVPYWLEQKPVVLGFYTLVNNLTNFFDINYYFFGSYPREMQIPGEFLKFPFIYAVFMLIALVEIIKKKNRYLFVYFLVTIATVAILGDKNHLGLFVVFPFLVLAITLGILNLIDFAKQKSPI